MRLHAPPPRGSRCDTTGGTLTSRVHRCTPLPIKLSGFTLQGAVGWRETCGGQWEWEHAGCSHGNRRAVLQHTAALERPWHALSATRRDPKGA